MLQESLNEHYMRLSDRRHPNNDVHGGPKREATIKLSEIVLNRIKACQMRLAFIVKLKYKSSTIVLFVGINYSMRNLRCDVNNYASPAK